MKRQFNLKMPLHRSWGILMFLTVLLFSCSKKLYEYKKECEAPGNEVSKTSTEPGNYFYVMKMSMDKYKSLKSKGGFKRFIFQFRNTKSKAGRNEFEMDSYSWKHGIFNQSFTDSGFAIPATDMPLLLIEPKGAYTFVNLELRHQHITKKAFGNSTYIYLIPYYDQCKNVMSLKMVGDSSKPKANTVGYKNARDNSTRHYAMNISYQPAGNSGTEKQLPGHLLFDLLALESELEINPCPPDRPHGNN